MDNLVEACSDALYDMEGINKGISTRTVQADIQIMRSDKLGFFDTIEVYDNKYYRYTDPDYSITDSPISADDYESVVRAINLIKKYKADGQVDDLDKVLNKVKDTLYNMLK